MEEKVRYFHFPLFLLRNLFKDKEKTMNIIMGFGIYNYIPFLEINEDQIARQVCYGMYRGGLTTALKKKLKKYIKTGEMTYDDEKCGFEIDGFNPEVEMNDLNYLFTQDTELYRLSYEYYQVSQSLYFYSLEGNIDEISATARSVKKIIPDDEPYCMINKDHVFEFRDNEKSETELAELAMFLAMRSIQGKKLSCRTNKQLVVSRMFGYANPNLALTNMPEWQKPLYDKYMNRYHFDKIKNNLELNWYVNTYSNHMRGFAISIDYGMSLDNLAFETESKKRKHKLAELRSRKQQAKDQAFKKIKEQDESTE